jgi:AcrR family transcriptional regulator
MSQAEMPRSLRKQETRERIMEAAARLYLSRGLDGVSLDEVARAAERTKGAVYGHFADKQALLIEVWRAHYAQKRALIGGALARASAAASLMEELRRAMTAAFALGPWPALAVDVRRRPDYAALAAELDALERAEIAALAGHYAALAADMGLPAPNPEETAATLFALAEGLSLRETQHPEIAADRFMAVAARLAGL